jgi:hypothetical protein
MIQGIEVRTALGQPRETDVMFGCQFLTGPCRVACVLIQEHHHVPRAVSVMNQFQEGPKIIAALGRADQFQLMSGADVDRSQQDAFHIGPAQFHLLGMAAATPTAPQRWKQPQIGFILGQDDAARPQSPQKTANFPFFSPAPDRAPACSEARFQV